MSVSAVITVFNLTIHSCFPLPCEHSAAIVATPPSSVTFKPNFFAFAGSKFFPKLTSVSLITLSFISFNTKFDPSQTNLNNLSDDDIDVRNAGANADIYSLYLLSFHGIAKPQYDLNLNCLEGFNNSGKARVSLNRLTSNSYAPPDWFLNPPPALSEGPVLPLVEAVDPNHSAKVIGVPSVFVP